MILHYSSVIITLFSEEVSFWSTSDLSGQQPSAGYEKAPYLHYTYIVKNHNVNVAWLLQASLNVFQSSLCALPYNVLFPTRYYSSKLVFFQNPSTNEQTQRCFIQLIKCVRLHWNLAAKGVSKGIEETESEHHTTIQRGKAKKSKRENSVPK